MEAFPKNNGKFIKILIVVVVLLLGYAIYMQLYIRQLTCDIADGFFAERRFTYPILKELGYNPDDYGKEATNPITSLDKYSGSCSPKNGFIF